MLSPKLLENQLIPLKKEDIHFPDLRFGAKYQQVVGSLRRSLQRLSDHEMRLFWFVQRIILQSFDLLLGQTVLRLEPNQHFSELPDDSRIVSGDLLHLRHTATTAPEPMDTNQSSISSMQVNPPSSVHSDIRTATKISSNQSVSFSDENVPKFSLNA
ncbi:hypothetical protein DdX_18176 [Ditylenchus destructor]|uniref:Uncharacterized protein n=1 Tax=Ditylenchus destructor TaxID=166010 RepID=A0AAD4QYJ1_9BILA|nr:hypothetical protein DdX_18176 [Ditylenchus destructor]